MTDTATGLKPGVQMQDGTVCAGSLAATCSDRTIFDTARGVSKGLSRCSSDQGRDANPENVPGANGSCDRTITCSSTAATGAKSIRIRRSSLLGGA